MGREQLAEAAGGGKQGCQKLQTANRENPIQTHMTVNAVIEASPEGAIGKSYLVYPGVQGITGDGTHTGHVGGYQDVYVKTAQGLALQEAHPHLPARHPGQLRVPARRAGAGDEVAVDAGSEPAPTLSRAGTARAGP